MIKIFTKPVTHRIKTKTNADTRNCCVTLHMPVNVGPVGWPIIGNLIGFAVKGIPNLCQELEPKYGKILKVGGDSAADHN